ncbi:MAG: type VI secretion protein ImpA, partial [Phycisphaerae bacterium SM23_30]
MAKTQQHRLVAVNTPLGEDVLLLRNFSYSEALGSLFEMELELLSEKNDIKFPEIVGWNVTVRLALADDKTRYFNGFISRFSQAGQENGQARYRATARPWLWFLTQTSDCRIFQNQTAPEIIKQIFRDAGFTDLQDDLQGNHRPWEYCVQYRETDFNFVSRLMEQEGIYYYWKHENGKHTMVLVDDSSAHAAYPGYQQIPYYPPTQQARQQDYIFEWSIEQQVQPRIYTHTDFNFETPRSDIMASRKIDRKDGAEDFEIFDYPGEYTNVSEGETYARIRIEEIQAECETLRGETTARGISAGFTFSLTNHPRPDQNRSYLVTTASVSAAAPDYTSGGSEEQEFSCSFAALDATQPYRPLRITPKPTIQGPQTAMVVGSSGEEIDTDKYGRVKVQFHWDRYGKADENSSCWVRVAQIWAGKRWGGITLPRVGHEVIVEFLEGDPDRPIITGEVYNAET